MKKRSITLLLAILVLLSLFSSTAIAAKNGTYGPMQYTVNNGKITITSCNENASGELVIPATINGYPVTEIGNSAFVFCSRLTRVEIPYGVTRIGMSAFWDCTDLESVVIPGTVTQIGESAFWCCGLKQAAIPEGVTEINGLFYHCTSLQAVSLPKSLKVIGSCTFAGCDRLKDVYYAGTSAQWKQISISSGADEAASGSVPNGNIQLQRTTIHYGSVMPDSGFTDVLASDYFAAPVCWAVDHQITQGTGNHRFSPNAACTRGQVVTFLWRAKGCPAPKTKSNPFSDVNVNEYYGKAVLWAVENGITQGTGGGRFSPNTTVTRAQAVTFLWRAKSQPRPSGANPFRDVSAGEYYADAVRWAVAFGITNGTTGTTFSPNNPCTRAQIVTFLYRDMK